jgi:hypothetical protein
MDCPAGKTSKSAVNQRQVIVHFFSWACLLLNWIPVEIWMEYHERKNVCPHITSISIGPLPMGRIRSKYLVCFLIIYIY